MAGRYNFPAWNYGYTLGPAEQGNNGNYTTSYNFYGGYRGRGGRGGQAGGRGGGGGGGHQLKPAEILFQKGETVGGVKKEEKAPELAAAPSTAPKEEAVAKVEEGGAKEEGEIEEKSLQSILRGRNPVMFCNDQSKLRNMHMEWEQVSEIGPPHDKTFEYQLKMGDLIGKGIGKCKKDSKTKAAEDMVLKLDALPKPGFNKRPMGGQGFNPGYGNYGRGGGYNQSYGNQPFKKRRSLGRSEEEMILKANDVTPKSVSIAQDNPISKLFEFAKRQRWPEPLFDTIEENVLDSRRVASGFTLKKTEFTIRCTVRQGLAEEKLFLGKALTKKQAKHNAAATAWAEIGGGVTAASVDNLLSGLKKEVTEKKEDLAAKKAATDAAVDAALSAAAKSASAGSEAAGPSSAVGSSSAAKSPIKSPEPYKPPKFSFSGEQRHGEKGYGKPSSDNRYHNRYKYKRHGAPYY